LETADLNDDANSPLHDASTVSATKEARENATLLPTILPLRATSDDDLAAARPSVEHDEAYYSELEIAKALARHSVEIGLPKHWLRTKPLGIRGQDARRWNQGQENLIEESCLDCVKFISLLSLNKFNFSAPARN